MWSTRCTTSVGNSFWSASKTFVRDWREMIGHASDSLMENAVDPDEDPVLESRKIRLCTIKPAGHDL
jgi:hypothetical protein